MATIHHKLNLLLFAIVLSLCIFIQMVSSESTTNSTVKGASTTAPLQKQNSSTTTTTTKSPPPDTGCATIEEEKKCCENTSCKWGNCTAAACYPITSKKCESLCAAPITKSTQKPTTTAETTTTTTETTTTTTKITTTSPKKPTGATTKPTQKPTAPSSTAKTGASSGRHFDGISFLGGILLIIFINIGALSFYFYRRYKKRMRGRNYSTVA